MSRPSRGRTAIRAATDETGPGTVAAVLASTFPHVFVSDAGANNLNAAAASLSPTSRFSFRHAPAEAADTWLPPSTVDFASIGMAFHYMDADAALRSVAKTLKPGGTLAAVTYGFRLLFPGRPRAQQLWYDVVSAETTRLIREGKVFPAAVKGAARAMTGLDFVPVPGELYRAVRRVYINITPEEERPFCFLEPDGDVWKPATSAVAGGEEKDYVEDAGWGRQADGTWLRGFLASSQLGFDERTWDTQGWKELEEIVAAGPEGKVEIRWPVAVLLASRRAD